MTVYVVIPTFNRRDILRACLESLAKQTIRPLVAVSDSGSSDGTLDMLASAPLETIVCRGTSDLWWTGAINLALREVLRRCSPGDWILCLNDDTTVGSEYIANILKAAQRRPNRIIGSVAVESGDPDLIIDGGNRVNFITARLQSFNRGRRLSEFPLGHGESVNVLPGRGTLYPARVFRELGLFDETLPHYGADHEFAVRCERAGYALAVSYDAVVRARTELTGIRPSRQKFQWREAYGYFFSRRSSCNLQDRFRYAWLTRLNFFTAMIFYAISVVRIVKNYFLGPAAPRHTI